MHPRQKSFAVDKENELHSSYNHKKAGHLGNIFLRTNELQTNLATMIHFSKVFFFFNLPKTVKDVLF